MKKPYVITDKLYKDYCNLVNNEKYSKAAACRKLKVSPSTMRDHIKRIDPQIEFALIKRKDSVTFIIDQEFYKLKYDSFNYESNKAIFEDIISKEIYTMTNSFFRKYILSLKYTDVANKTSKLLNSKIEDNKLMYKGVNLSKDFVKAISVLGDKSKDKERLTRFADMLIKNPSKNACENLYKFLVHNDIEICNNGYILAYKFVTKDFKDDRTKKIDNRVGKNVSMPREQVVDDPNVTCAAGLHVGSLSYINDVYKSSYGHIIQVIVSPENVVSVPNDYNGSKMRVCKYKVVKCMTQ